MSSIPQGIEIRTGDGDDEVLLQTADLAGGKVEMRMVERVSVAGGAVVEAGAGIDVQSLESIEVGAAAVLSTRRVAGDPRTAASTGNSGPLVLAAPAITVRANAQLLAHVQTGSPRQPGQVTLTAENVVTSAEFLLQGQAQKDPRAVERSATISLEQGVVVRGADVRLEAEAGDFMPASLTESELKLIENLSVPALGYATRDISIPALTALKNSAAEVQLGDGVQIASSGDVVIDARANATAKMTVVSGAGVLGGTPLSIFSIVYTRADSSAEAVVGPNASIVAAGSVNVLAHSDAEASSTSRTTKNVGNARPTNKDDLALSAAISDVNNTSYATVREGATLTAGDNVYVHATGSSTNSASGESGIYQDGLVGTAVAWGTTDSDIQSVVNGTLTAGGTTAARTIPFDADNGIVTVNEKEWIQLSAGHMLATGDAVLAADAVHFIVVDIGNSNRVGLASSMSDALAGTTIEVSSLDFGDDAPSLVPVNGIDIRGRLETTESSTAVTGIGGPPSGEEYVAKKELAFSFIDRIRDSLSGVTREAKEKNYLGDVDIAFTASLAFINDANQVVARVGPATELKSERDVTVNADLTAKLQTSSESSVSAPSDGEQQTDAVSVALVIGLYDNLAIAQVASQATVDARRDVSVQSQVEYPFITTPSEFISDQDFANPNNLQTFFDKLGVSSRLFNSWARSVAKSTPDKPTLVDPSEAATDPDKRDSDAKGFGISGSVSYLDYRNASRAEIGGGQLFHPDTALNDDSSIHLGPGHALATGDAVVYRSLGDAALEGLTDGDTYYVIVDTADPRRIRLAASAGNAQSGQAIDVALGEAREMLHSLEAAAASTTTAVNQYGAIQNAAQAVKVHAASDMKLLSLNGVFDLEISQATLSKLKQDGDPLGLLSPIGAEGKSLGVGAAVYLFDLQTDTAARVGEDVQLASPAGLDVKSMSNVLDVVLAQSGAQSQSYGFAGTVTYISHSTSSVAQIESGAQITAGPLDVTADDTTRQVNVAGGVMRGNHRGAGVTVAVNEMDRRTAALIGEPGLAAAGAERETDIQAGDITLAATADGGVYAFTLAAAVMTRNKPRDNPQDSSGLVGRSNAALSSQNARTEDEGNQGKYGVGVSGDASVNTITDVVQALIVDSGTVDGNVIAISAVNDTDLVSLAGAAVLNTNQMSAGIAGAFSKVALEGTTEAAIEYAMVTGNNLTLTSRRGSDLFSIAAGGSAAPSKSGTGVAGSVTWNDVTDTVRAEMLGSRATLNGSVVVDADNDSSVKSIAGAAAFGGRAGLGAAVASNDITADTKATIDSTTLDLAAALTVTADNASDLFTITAAAGISTGSVGLAGTVSVNRVAHETEASVKRTEPASPANAATGDITILASDTAAVTNYAGAIGLARTGGLGAAVAYNDIFANVNAFMQDARLSTAGDATVRVSAPARIDAYAAGVAGGRTFALGGSATFNSISINAGAYLAGSELVADDLAVEASDGVGAAFDPATAVSGSIIHLSVPHGLQTGDVVVYGSGGDKPVGGLEDGMAYYVERVDAQRLRLKQDPALSAISLSTSQTTGQRHVLSTSGVSSFAGGVAVASTAAAGAAVALNQISNSFAATISDSVVGVGRSHLLSTSQVVISAWSLGGAGAGTFALGGSFTKNDVHNNVNAAIRFNSTLTAARDVELLAFDRSAINVRAGGIGLASTAGIGAAVATNNIGSAITADIDASSLTVGGDIVARAESATTVNSFTIGGAGAGTFALGGAVSLNTAGNLVRARAGRGTRIDAAGTVVVAAADDVDSLVFSGGFAGAGTAAVGAAVSTLETNNVVSAFVDESVEIDADGNGAGQLVPTGSRNSAGAPRQQLAHGLAVVATSWEDIQTLAVGGAGAGTGAVAGSASANNLNETTEAYIRRGARINLSLSGGANQDVHVLASDETDVMGLGGALAGGGAAGVGAGLDVGTFNKVTRAFIDAAADVLANGNIRVSSLADEDVLSISGAVGAGGTAGLAGGASIYLADIYTRAFIGQETQVIGSPQFTFGRVFGGGDTIDRDEGSWQADGFRVGQTVKVMGSDGREHAFQIAEVTASRLTLEAHNNVTPLIGDGALALVYVDLPPSRPVVAQGNVIVHADDHSEIDLFTGVIAAGGVAALGGGAGVPVVNKMTEAFIGATANVAGLALRASDFVFSGEFQIRHEANSSSATEVDSGSINTNNAQGVEFDDSLLQQRIAEAQTRGVKGVSVTAVNRDDLEVFSISAGASGAVGVQLSADVHVVNNTTRAFIDDLALVNFGRSGFSAGDEQGVHVAAGNDFYRLGVAGTASISGLASFTPSFDGVFVTNTTEAYIGRLTRVYANADINVLATSREDVMAISAGLAGSGGAGVAGAVALIKVDNDTSAHIDFSAFVASDENVLVRAQDHTNADIVAGAVGFGLGGGAGASVSATVIDKQTRAYVDGAASVDARANGAALIETMHADGQTRFVSGVVVEALSSEDVFSVAGTGAGGLFAALAGAASVELIHSDTEAFLGASSTINSANSGSAVQDVHVGAINETTILAIGATASVGGVALGGGVDVGKISNATAAYIASGATVHAKRDVQVVAASDRDIESITVSLAGGLLGFGGAVTVYSIAGDLQSTTPDGRDNGMKDVLTDRDGKGTGNYLRDQAKPSKLSEVLGAYARPDVASARQRLDGATGNSAKIVLSPVVSAFVGEDAVLHVAHDVDVTANATTTAIAEMTGVAIGGLTVGVSLADVRVFPTVTAEVRDRAAVTAGHDIFVHAVHNLASWRGPQGIQRFTSDNYAVTRAEGSASSGSLVGGLGAETFALTSSTLGARTGSFVRLRSQNDIRVETFSGPETESTIDKFAVGIVANIGSIDSFGRTFVQADAEIGPSSSLTATGAVSLQAYAWLDAHATSDGDGGGGLDVSDVFSVARAGYDVDATVAPNARIDSTFIWVNAFALETSVAQADIGSLGAISVPTAEARSLVGFSDQSASATEIDSPSTTDVLIGSDAVLTAAHTVSLSADNDPYAYAFANALGVGLASDVDVYVDVELFTDSNVTLGDRVRIGGATGSDASTSQPGVYIGSTLHSPRLAAVPWVASGGLFSDSDIELDIDYVRNSNITAPASARITTNNLTVVSEINSPELRIDPNSSDYSIPFGTNDISTNIRFNRQVAFDARVNLMAWDAYLSATSGGIEARNVLYRNEANKVVVTGTTVTDTLSAATIKMPAIATVLAIRSSPRRSTIGEARFRSTAGRATS